MTLRVVTPTPKTLDKLVMEIGSWTVVPARSAHGKTYQMRLDALGGQDLHTHDEVPYPPYVGQWAFNDGCYVTIREKPVIRRARRKSVPVAKAGA